MCEIMGVKRNRLNYIVITQTLFYNYLTRTNLKSFLHAIVISTEERNLEDSSLRSEWQPMGRFHPSLWPKVMDVSFKDFKQSTALVKAIIFSRLFLVSLLKEF